MQVGIVGLPFAGKTTLFQTLLSQRAESNGIKSKQSTERGIIKIGDDRLDRLTALFQPQKKVPAQVEYIKITGLDPLNESGLSSQFFTDLKIVEEIVLVVRAFEDDLVPHPFGLMNPFRDLEFALSEFVLSDLLIIEKRLERLAKQLQKKPEATDQRELLLLQKCRLSLEEGRAMQDILLSPEEQMLLKGYQFLSVKPRLAIFNISEADLMNPERWLSDRGSLPVSRDQIMPMCLKIEREIAELHEADRQQFLDELGIGDPALNRLVRKSYDLLGLISFFTVGADECRAWTIRRGMTAQQAAGVIHSDLERGFIRADVVSCKELLEQGSLSACRQKGLLRLEGKEYVVQDGDVMEIRFNV
ncbi:MAG TPA: redox-regulated ATPase YchF [Candidatus Marinimicrobia bacterium]|nr:redox-regulated ATPase YchF [Candidatus Neomarinimicrobiota bacterium]